MAEGYLRHFTGNKINVYSAGIETHGVNQRAIESMSRDGIDISQQTSNNVSEYSSIPFDFVITVCDNARENCPWFPSEAIKLHYNFPDPAKATGSEEEITKSFDATRDMIRQYITNFVQQYLSGLR